ncbi:hypothetical protein THAOC_17002 [Thalassiosira oceanica]|uniref:Uncharacterized protein n=1 Tax=Thalassiosira oceanica TaxID=159749 RepID=K0S8B6_THAOC|nr:hypothetical protein THAOC_17002 [Thalassiosira oceanica]|eukprot:EJK62388.1 hypothetical protein THAOC_17002 [Thalassiosira oceanica]
MAVRDDLGRFPHLRPHCHRTTTSDFRVGVAVIVHERVAVGGRTVCTTGWSGARRRHTCCWGGGKDNWATRAAAPRPETMISARVTDPPCVEANKEAEMERQQHEPGTWFCGYGEEDGNGAHEEEDRPSGCVSIGRQSWPSLLVVALESHILRFFNRGVIVSKIALLCPHHHLLLTHNTYESCA